MAHNSTPSIWENFNIDDKIADKLKNVPKNERKPEVEETKPEP